jgi:hypothetical protein
VSSRRGICFRKEAQRIGAVVRNNEPAGKRLALQTLHCVTYCFDHLVRARLATMDLFILIPISARGRDHISAKRRLLLSIPYGQGSVQPICIHGRLLHQGHFIYLLYLLHSLGAGAGFNLGISASRTMQT